MHTVTKRTIIATAALAAAGLFGSLPYDGSPVAQQGVPTVHRDVALVDDYTTLLTDEGTYDAALYNDVLGPTGAEETLYTDLGSNANTLLDTTSYAGDFNGAETAGFDGLYLDGLATEDEVNQLVGATATESQASIVTDLTATGGVSSTDLSELTAAEGTSAFDTDLTSFANADYSLAFTDFEGYLTSLSGDTSGLSDLSTILTDLTSSLDLSGLSGDLTTVLGDLGSLF